MIYMMNNTQEYVSFKCKDCGYEETKPKYDPVTGIVHGNGWCYICPSCNGCLRIKDS